MAARLTSKQLRERSYARQTSGTETKKPKKDKGTEAKKLKKDEGAVSKAFIRRRDGTLDPQDPWGHVLVEPGETIVSVSAGGGGYGEASSRDPGRVAHDVREGWVSVDRARKTYRVELDQAGAVDSAGTAALKAGRTSPVYGWLRRLGSNQQPSG